MRNVLASISTLLVLLLIGCAQQEQNLLNDNLEIEEVANCIKIEIRLFKSQQLLQDISNPGSIAQALSYFTKDEADSQESSPGQYSLKLYFDNKKVSFITVHSNKWSVSSGSGEKKYYKVNSCFFEAIVPGAAREILAEEKRQEKQKSNLVDFLWLVSQVLQNLNIE